MGNRELDLIHKICNTQDFDEILLNIVKQRKDNWIKRILDNISEDVSIGEETKRQIGVRIDIWTHFMRECIINYVH